MPTYPSPAAVATFVNTVRPVGPRDPSLWGYAYAADRPAQFAETGTQGLADFQAFQANAYAWVGGTHYWDVDFLLAYIQANGDFPAGPDPFTAWLASNGYAIKQADGSYAKTGKYPVGGTGYPPGGAATAAAGGTSGSSSGNAPATGNASFDRAVAWVRANPVPVVAGGVAALLLFRRK